MRTLRLTIGGLLVASAALLGFASTAGAASTADRTYAGVFGGHVSYQGCTTSHPNVTASGDWSVTLHGGTAKADFTIYTSADPSTPHVQYVFPSMKQTLGGGDQVFSAYGLTQAGVLTITLKQSGSFTYVIAPYSIDGVSCDVVTYYGTVS